MKSPLEYQEINESSCLVEMGVRTDSMLNYKPKIINTHDSKSIKICQKKDFKSEGIIKLLTKIWEFKKSHITSEQIIRIYNENKKLLEGLSEKERKKLLLIIHEYIKANSNLTEETLKEAEGELVKQEILTKGASMDIVEEYFKEKGLFEGRQKGLKEGKLEGKQKGLQEGLQKGLQEGKQETQVKVALKLLREGFDKLKVSEILDLPLEEVIKLDK